MSVAINSILIAAVIAISLFFYRYSVRTSKVVAKLQEDIGELQRRLKTAGIVESPLVSERPGYQLAIEIVDPIEIAKRESALARYVNRIVPDLLTREVYKQVQSELSLALKERGIETNMRIIAR